MKNLSFNPLMAFAIWAAIILVFNRHDFVFYGLAVVASVFLAIIYGRTTDEARQRSDFFV